MSYDPRKLHLKIRVRTTRPMSATTARLLLERFLQTGRVPAGIEVRGIDWAKGNTGSGRVPPSELRRAIRMFSGAIDAAPTKRFALVDRGAGAKAKVPADAAGRPKRDRQGRYRDAKGRFISKAQYDAMRGRFTVEQEEILDEMRQSLRGSGVGRAAEFEWTATTKGGTPRRRD